MIMGLVLSIVQLASDWASNGNFVLVTTIQTVAAVIDRRYSMHIKGAALASLENR